MVSIVGGELKGVEHPDFRRCWRLAKTQSKVRNGALTLRDVKNEGTSGDVYENKGEDDKMSFEKPPVYMKMYEWRDN